MGKREFIARNVAAMFHDGDVVNLGVGIPTLASTYVPEGMTVLFHAENGCVGAGEAGGFPWDFSTRESVIAWLDTAGAGEKGAWKNVVHKDLCNASGEVITLIPGACCFDSYDGVCHRARRPPRCDRARRTAGRRGLQPCQLEDPRKEAQRHGRRNGHRQRRQKGHHRHGTLHEKWGCEDRGTLLAAAYGARLCEYDRDGAVHHRLQAGCLTVTAIAPA